MVVSSAVSICSCTGGAQKFCQANRARQRQRRQRRIDREQAAADAEQASADAEQASNVEQAARIVGQVAAERVATRAAEVQTEQWEEIEQTDSEEARGVMEECDAKLERMLSRLEL